MLCINIRLIIEYKQFKIAPVISFKEISLAPANPELCNPQIPRVEQVAYIIVTSSLQESLHIKKSEAHEAESLTETESLRATSDGYLGRAPAPLLRNFFC